MSTATILVGDVLERMAEIPDGSVQCCVTSPPYWGLRSYLPDGVILRDDLTESEKASIIQELLDLGIVPIEVLP